MALVKTLIYTQDFTRPAPSMSLNELVNQQDRGPDIHTEVTVDRACTDFLDRIWRLAMGSIVDKNIHSAKSALGGIEQLCGCQLVIQVGGDCNRTSAPRRDLLYQPLGSGGTRHLVEHSRADSV